MFAMPALLVFIADEQPVSYAPFVGPTLALGFAVGIFYFVKGFRIYRELRTFSDTPEVPISSVAMGLAHIHGKSGGAQKVRAPVSGKDCYFYQVRIKRWESYAKQGAGYWADYATLAEGVQFHLADDSGKIMVDARGAEFDLPESGRREIASDSSKVWPESEREFGTLIERARPGTWPGPFLLVESAIFPNTSYEVIGACAENPESAGERNIITRGRADEPYLISSRSEKVTEQNLRRRAAMFILGGSSLALTSVAAFLYLLNWL